MLTDAIQKFIATERVWLLVAGIAGLAVVWFLLSWTLRRLRKRFKSPPARPAGSGWSLKQARKLHKSGQLTDKQYEDLRGAILKGLEKEGPRRRSGR